jgi:hypothetical protein
MNSYSPCELAPRRGLSRRGFLAGAAAVIAAPQVLSAAVLGKDGQTAPSDRITIGMPGVGNRGSSSLSSMQPLAEHQVVAIADCRRDRRTCRVHALPRQVPTRTRPRPRRRPAMSFPTHVRTA